MPHLDEGHIHALLDGELTAAEREVAEEHLRACAECQQLVTEARSLFAEADRLVEALTPPATRGQPARQPTAFPLTTKELSMVGLGGDRSHCGRAGVLRE